LAQLTGSFGTDDSIAFDSSLNGQTITLTDGEIFVESSVIVTGPGAGLLTISGNDNSQVFEMAPDTTVFLDGLTIGNGRFNGNGAGIANGGTLTVTNSVISDNALGNNGSVG